MLHRANCEAFLRAYRDIVNRGEELITRGQRVKELRNYSIQINPTYPMTSFKARKFNLDYAKKEVLWYLRGNRFDLSICKEAGAWNTLVQPDGGINSNYGQVIFKGPRQFDWVIEELVRDQYSRRAVMVIADANLLSEHNTDHRCTMYVQYCIRDGCLHQNVHMRSNDAIFGMTNDVFFYGILHMMVHTYLKRHYPDLKIGVYTHCADSLHIYERHFTMAHQLLVDDVEGWYEVYMPPIQDTFELDVLRFTQASVLPADTFAQWLRTFDKE